MFEDACRDGEFYSSFSRIMPSIIKVPSESSWNPFTITVDEVRYLVEQKLQN